MNVLAQQSRLSNIGYQRFRDLILARTGILLGPRRRDALAGGVLAAAGHIGCESLGEYYRLLQGVRTDSRLWDNLIGAITVGETYFFRNPAHFDALRQHILPDLIARHRDDRRLRIWSAGCATGEEPYSIAILLRQLLPDIANWDVFILATDINKQCLQQARQGRYYKWSFRNTDPAIRELYFTPQDELFELSPQVREMITLAYLNLVEASYPSLVTNTNAMDLILCRNVAIYLPEAVVREMVERFHRCLVPEGWLIVGAAETDSEIYREFAVRNFPGAIIYQKVAEPLAALPFPELRREPFHYAQDMPVELPAEGACPGAWPAVQLLPELVEGPRPESACPEPSRGARPEPSRRAREPLLPHPEPLDFVRGVPVEGQPTLPTDPYQEGLALLGQGQYEDAMARFLARLEREPDFAPAYYQMARVHANRGRLEEAQSWCQQAIKRDPLLTEAHYTLALIHQEEGALDQAIAQLRKTLYLDPNFVLAHFSLSNLYQQMDRPDEAARHRTQAIRLAVKMPPNHVVPGSDGLTAARLLTMVQATL
jgi:chemotaxis protein methyltransferase CheR